MADLVLLLVALGLFGVFAYAALNHVDLRFGSEDHGRKRRGVDRLDLQLGNWVALFASGDATMYLATSSHERSM